MNLYSENNVDKKQRANLKDQKVKLKEQMPSVDSLRVEIANEKYRQRYVHSFRSLLYILILAVAVGVLLATLWFPVLHIYGDSMSPTLSEGDVVVSVKNGKWKQGELICFWYNNKILVKRVIAGPGDWVDITNDGTVSVNGTTLVEPYLSDRALGNCDISLPYQVPDNSIFVMGDNRSVSIDSRSSVVGCIPEEQIVGKIAFRIWPFRRLGFIKQLAKNS